MLEINTVLHNRWIQTDGEVGVISFRCWIVFSLCSRLSYYVYILMAPDFRHCFLYGRALDQDITGFTFRKRRNGWILRIFCQSYGSNFALHLRLQECVNAYELYSQAFGSWDVFQSADRHCHYNDYIWFLTYLWIATACI